MKKIILILFIALQVKISFAIIPKERPYVILISFDGFRWDYPNRGITPNLTKLEAQGVKAISLQPAFPSKTFPNHYSIVTGLYPQNHGLIANQFKNPFTLEEYRLGDTTIVRSDKWYQGETIWATANREGVKTASFFWPGSETHASHKHPTYFKRYDGSIPHDERIQGIIDWLSLPEEDRPHFLLLYFSDTDDSGHRFGPDSEETNQAIQLLDTKLGLLFDKLKKLDIYEEINTILVSDHGMTNISPEKTIIVSRFFDKNTPEFFGSGPLIQFFAKTEKEKQHIYNQLQKKENKFKVYTKENIPTCFNYGKQAFIGDVVAIAGLGYSFVKNEKQLKQASENYSKGDHGYDNHALDMHGIFYAAGPAFKQGYQTGTFMNVDIYPLVCNILNLTPNNKIDGRLDRIEFILK